SIRKQYKLAKLGEASYSEVFIQTPKPVRGKKTDQQSSQDSIVLKLIPFGKLGQCGITQIINELRITATMSPVPGYIGLRNAHVVQGYFPEFLLKEWDRYDQYVKESENERPDFYEEDQYFILIGLEHGGCDLEKWPVQSYSEAS